MLNIHSQPLTPELKKRFDAGFSRHSIATTGYDEKHEPISFVAMEGDTYAGAIAVEIFWGALHIKFLFVEEPFRGRGLATQLMEHGLTYGYEKECPFAFVETMSFQALEFYQKLGFELEYTRDGYSHGTAFHYLKKTLIPIR